MINILLEEEKKVVLNEHFMSAGFVQSLPPKVLFCHAITADLQLIYYLLVSAKQSL